MNLLRLPDFQTVAAGQTATLKLSKYLLTLDRLVLKLGGGTFNKGLIESIKIKIGSRVVWSVETFGAVAGGTFLDRINKYRGLFDQAMNIVLDLTERDFMNIIAREIGGIDMSQFAEDVFVEVKIASGAVTPTLSAYGQFTPPQSTTPGKPTDDEQLIQKLLSTPFSYPTGGRYYLPFEPRGALLKRIYLMFTGAQGAAGVNSNLWKVEIKKNGNTIFDPEEADFRFVQQEFRKVPQSNMYVMDFTFDNLLSGALNTGDAQSLEFILNFTAADSGVAFFEVLDKPFNL